MPTSLEDELNQHENFNNGDETWGARLRLSGAIVIEMLFVVSLILLILELGSRLVHWGKRPAIPHITDSYNTPRMPSDIDYQVQLPQRDVHRICTDELGIRHIDCSSEDDVRAAYKMLIIGDSQALGWGMEARDTLAAKLAELYQFEPSEVGIAAVAGADVESLYSWAKDISLVHSESLEKVVLYVNEGNDLDEMYLGRTSGKVANFQGLSQWLGVNSFLYLDFILIKQALFGGVWSMAPGTNPVLFMLNDKESKVYAKAIADSCERLLNLWPDRVSKTVLLVPNDYQVFHSEFDKYNHFYPSEELFLQWRAKVREGGEILNRYQRRLTRFLDDKGIPNVKASLSISQLTAEEVFDRSSHHLTPLANEVIAKQFYQKINQGE